MYQYFDKIIEKLKIVEKEEKYKIEGTIDLLVEAIEKKQSIYIFGASHAGILTQEMYYRAGGLMVINPIFGREIMLDTEPITLTSQMERLEGYGENLGKTVDFKENDVLILHSVSGRNSVILDLGLYAKKKGVKIIALTNLEYSKSVESRHSSRKKLYELADITIDNHGDIGDAMCEIEGLEQKVGPSSTVVGATILNTIVSEVCKKLIENGKVHPPIYYSANLDGGDELNKKLKDEFKELIHYRY
ncbi:sugar isomerase domain-containing protein [Miniphocaeibacter halophilus]|uniref:SIS domain-containing protein n=1 Tax=Miniphocaeibacter halophilus TaxID=2931922 RepID=A0AC61MQT1_9FIRM|nr:SIS domain-containing protein [Miniphocaeibacter halophilus]QQK06945.1 SIS domain-containing protein [Miniphocaeibacter halophilus]